MGFVSRAYEIFHRVAQSNVRRRMEETSRRMATLLLCLAMWRTAIGPFPYSSPCVIILLRNDSLAF
jgi:hypothetical protein